MQITKGAVSMFLYEVNHLVDRGENETIRKVNEQMQNKTIVQYLTEKYKGEIDLSLFTGQRWEEEMNNLLCYFSECHAGNERRKWGIYNNGLCLLVSWCAEILRDWSIYTQ